MISLLLTVEVRTSRSTGLQPGGPQEVEEWSEAAEEGPVPQPGPQIIIDILKSHNVEMHQFMGIRQY